MLNASPALLGVNSSLPFIWSNNSKTLNLEADFLPNETIPITFPYLETVTVSHLNATNLFVNNASV